MPALTICSDFGAPKNKVCHCFHCFSTYWPWSNGKGSRGRSIYKISVKGEFNAIKWLQEVFSSSSLSAIRVVSSAYLRLLIFLPAILIPTCPSSMLKRGRTLAFLSCLLAFDIGVLVVWLPLLFVYRLNPQSSSISKSSTQCRIKYFHFTPPATFLVIINGICFILSCIIISYFHICLFSETENTPWQELAFIYLWALLVPIGCT